jgi:hypothetical protein
MKTVRFTLYKDISSKLSKIELSPGITMLDAFMIKTDGMGSYLYEMITHSPINQTIELIKEHIDFNIQAIGVSDVWRFNIVVNTPNIITEHKTKKEEKKTKEHELDN